MAQNGQAGKALGVSPSCVLNRRSHEQVALLTVAPLLGEVALKFGPVELFAVAVLGMTIIGSLSQGSSIKGLLPGAHWRYDCHGWYGRVR